MTNLEHLNKLVDAFDFNGVRDFARKLANECDAARKHTKRPGPPDTRPTHEAGGAAEQGDGQLVGCP